jgi:hypothetical protein
MMENLSREFVTAAEVTRFKNKMRAFRKSLDDKERFAFDMLLPPDQPQAAEHKKGDPDMWGKTKIDETHISKSDGGVQTCPAGETVHQGSTGANGKFAWYCGKA